MKLACQAGTGPRITYFANDLADAAVQRRVRMLRLGDARVQLIGYRRSSAPVWEVDGIAAADLGETYDGQLASRCKQIAWACLRNWQIDADVLLARNLDMLTVAYCAKRRTRSSARLVYECLDINSALLGDGIPAKVLRGWEKRLIANTQTLLVSSEAHIGAYFGRLRVPLPRVVVAENKRVMSTVSRPGYTGARRQPPWKIGWFGGLRCVESFHILSQLARRQPELVDITLRGRPLPEVRDLIRVHLPLPNMRFCGPYSQDDLATIYGDCDFVWAVEYFNENSEWALGNRLYEGGFYNSISIGLASTAMGEWLRRRGSGVLLQDPHTELEPFMVGLTPATYDMLCRSAARIRTDDLVWTIDGCRQFVRDIAGAAERAQ
jgi:succinoglycan biosynthesis protein ExoL